MRFVENRSPRGRRWLTAIGALALTLSVASCADRLEKNDEDAADSAPSVQLQAWAELHSEPYGIPERALRSYAYAAAAMGKAQPDCGLGWSTLAAIGYVSSDHGEANGASVGDDGVVSPELRNLLQARAKGAKPVPDTDAGYFDGATAVDYMMGPMQILPSRWEQFATDADNDGKASPDNFDDATLTTARMLCASAGGSMTKAENWTTAVGQFNPMPGFVEKVHAEAKRFGR